MDKRLIGILGEKLVCKWYTDRKYKLVGINYKTRFGEIDIIAETERYMVFVEVKTRTEGSLASGIDAVDSEKIRKLRNAATMFAKMIGTDLEPRIDVAEVTVSKGQDGKEVWKLKYLVNALV